MAEDLVWHTTFNNGVLFADEGYREFMALGDDPAMLPVYAVVLPDPEELSPLNMLYPNCLRFMVDAEEMDPLERLTMRLFKERYPHLRRIPRPPQQIRDLIREQPGQIESR